jgi:hypothetical protein
MTELQIRPAVSTDLSVLMAIDHSCQTDYVWQMDIQRDEGDTMADGDAGGSYGGTGGWLPADE